MKKVVTIKDIAQVAKVSATAVSMALNNRSGVSKRTRQRIQRIAKKLEYHPNFVAKSLISKRSHTIGLIINNIADPFYPELALGVEKKAAEFGYSLLVSNIGGSLEKEKQSLATLRGRGVDGVIIATATIDDPNIKALADDRFPFVLVNRFSLDPALRNKMDYVVLDNYACGYKAVEHLYRLGHDRIAILTGLLKVSTASMRTKAAIQALNDLGMDTDSKLIVECDYVPENAYRAAKRLLETNNRPTAFFAQDDYMAIAVREAIFTQNLRVPEDVALVGVDNIEMASISGVDLTTVSQNIYQMGTTGTDILIRKIERAALDSEMINQVIMEPKLILRRSCGYHEKGYVR